MTLNELENKLASLRKLGADGSEPIQLEATTRLSGLGGAQISIMAAVNGVALCEPKSMSSGRIVRIWGVPDEMP